MELDSDVNTPTDKHQLVGDSEFRSDKGKNNMEQEHAARSDKEHKELEDEGDGHRGIVESLFAEVHPLGLIDLVGVGTCRFYSHILNDKVFPLTKSCRANRVSAS
jgi:hypothetical protein